MESSRTPAARAESIARHERYVAADPSNALLRRALGDLYHQSGEFAMAIDCYSKCLELDPNDVAAKSRMAMVFISQHQFVDAERVIRELIDCGEQDAALFNN